MDSEPFAKGEEIPGTPYRHVSVLGRGGQGVVIEVEHTFLGSRAVMKLLNPQHVDRHDLSGRMRDEARALAAIRHPNIVRVTDGGLTGEKQPRPFFVMEKLDGDTLLAILRRRSGGLPLRSAIAIAAEILDALDVAHTTHRMIHRDVKPGNVFLARISPVEVRAVLLDFGVARMKKPSAFTGQHSFVGTFQYAAPEQLRGEVTPQSDLYALGLMLFEMLVGQHPFSDAQSVPEWVRFQTHRIPTRVDELRPEIPQPLARLVASALAKDPRQRPATALAFASELRLLRARYIDGQPSQNEANTEEMAVEQVVALVRGDATVVPPTARQAGGGTEAPHEDALAATRAPAPVPVVFPSPPIDPRRATADLPPATERARSGLHGTARYDNDSSDFARQTLAMDGAPRAQTSEREGSRPSLGEARSGSRPNLAAAWGAGGSAEDSREESWVPTSAPGQPRNPYAGAKTVPSPRKSRTGLVVAAIGGTAIFAALAIAAAVLGTRAKSNATAEAAPTATTLTTAEKAPETSPPAATGLANAPVAQGAPIANTGAALAAKKTTHDAKAAVAQGRDASSAAAKLDAPKPAPAKTDPAPPAADGVPRVKFD